ncbi:LPXTG cell wall anchor domain-containing protein, partial [Clostridium sp.]|uniref:LPXTG cell wall anchor domain-containing protein n=1 Tax=Clostridium sp. TaxID=1506 RepID=UPI002637DE8E
ENPTKPENIIKPGNENGKTNSLPQTGGTNSTIVFIFASLAVLTGVFMIIRKRKRKIPNK